MKRLILSLTVILGFALAGCQKNVSPSEDCNQFVNITDAVPDAILEIRYYSTYSFVGARIKIYDAYRPQMGVDHFVRPEGRTLPRHLFHLPRKTTVI